MKILISIKTISGVLNASEIMLRSCNNIVSADSKGRVMHLGILLEEERSANLSIQKTKSNQNKASITIQISGIEKEENKERIIEQIKYMIQKICNLERTKVDLRVEKVMVLKKN
ncbi:MAG: hypothetical protein WC011_00230 [Candidatus Paceibacterota bacterium]